MLAFVQVPNGSTSVFIPLCCHKIIFQTFCGLKCSKTPDILMQKYVKIIPNNNEIPSTRSKKKISESFLQVYFTASTYIHRWTEAVIALSGIVKVHYPLHISNLSLQRSCLYIFLRFCVHIECTKVYCRVPHLIENQWKSSNYTSIENWINKLHYTLITEYAAWFHRN